MPIFWVATPVQYAGSRGEFIGKCGVAVGDVLYVVVLVDVMRDVARFGAVVGVSRWIVLGVVV